MNFRKATDALLESVTLEDLANAMGVSVQTIRQARAAAETTAYRSPPSGWEIAVVRLATVKARRFSQLASNIATDVD